MSEEVDSHVMERYDIQKRLGKGEFSQLFSFIHKSNPSI